MKIFSVIFLIFPLMLFMSCGNKKASPELQQKIDQALESFLVACPRSLEYIDCGKISVKKAVTEKGGEWVVFNMALGKDFELYAINLEAYNGENLAQYMKGRVDGFMGPISMQVNGVLNFKLISSGRPGYGYIVHGSGDSNIAGSTSIASISSWVFEELSLYEKDLEKLGSKKEELKVDLMEDYLANFGFSSDRARILSKLMVSYNKIKTKRALTSREKDVFTKELTGLSFDKASSVLVDEGYDALVEKASEVNGADPEAIKEFLNEVIL